MTRGYGHPFATKGNYGNMYPPQFKAQGLPPVMGGRWSVRKLADGRWRAWTIGKAKRHARSFYTFEAAIFWAVHVSDQYKMSRDQKTSAALRDSNLVYKSHETKRKDIEFFIMFCGGVVTESAINRIMGDSRRGQGMRLARQSAINESLRRHN